MARTHTWEISDELWAIVEPLIPTPDELRDKDQPYQRKIGAGRKRKYSDRTFFAAIVYVLRTGIIWNAIPREKFGGLGSSVLHKRFQLWTKAGFFDLFTIRWSRHIHELVRFTIRWSCNPSKEE